MMTFYNQVYPYRLPFQTGWLMNTEECLPCFAEVFLGTWCPNPNVSQHGQLRFFVMVNLANIAMENDPFIDGEQLGLPIKHGDFPWRTVSHNQMVDSVRF